MHKPKFEFVKQFLPGIEAVLGWFERRMDDNGMLGHLDWFNFSDWTTGFLCGAPAGVDDGLRGMSKTHKIPRPNK